MDDFQTTFWSHVEALRSTFLQVLAIIAAGVFICLFFQETLLTLITFPLQQVVPSAQLTLLTPVEGFMTSIKLSIWSGLIVTLPVWVLPILKFIMPALNKQERGIILPFLILSSVALLLGASACYFFTLPIANAYFYQYNAAIGLNLWSLSAYIDYALMLIFGHALVAECGVILLFLVHYRIISADRLRSNRRIFIVAAFILGALVTPPDIPSQLMVAIPLIGMYELSILYARFRNSASLGWSSDVN